MTKEEPGKCSYLNCGREIFWPQGYTPQPEEKPCCIFHSPLIEQKKEAFRSAWQEFLDQHKNEKGEYQDLNCVGFIFPESVHFMDATFSGDARFSDATFSGWAGVVCATFSGAAGFEGATFSGDASFDFATFSGEAKFAGAKFHGDVSFNLTRWQGGADFSDAKLKEASLDFIGGNYKDKDEQEHDIRLFKGDKQIGFDHVNFREAKRGRFERVDLSRASFLRSQIENVDFIDVWG